MEILIITPSEWAKQILLQNNIQTPIEVVPQGVDTLIFDAVVPEDKQKDQYIFINIGKWEKRKGHDVLVEIFNKAFEENDNVELWMVNHNPFLSKDQLSKWYQLYADSKLKNKIRIFPRIPTQKHLSKIMAHSDCGIFPSRGEGWNNEAIEMMAMNKPIIITDYSAHTQYCNRDNSLLIDIKNTEPAKDDIWFNGSGNWASIEDNQIDQAVEHMRNVYSNRITTNENGLKTAQNLSWNKTTESIRELLYN
jgi:glycosyltransferase involved in cell wall biosynthesis